jgi:hypothetical protein
MCAQATDDGHVDVHMKYILYIACIQSILRIYSVRLGWAGLAGQKSILGVLSDQCSVINAQCSINAHASPSP